MKLLPFLLLFQSGKMSAQVPDSMNNSTNSNLTNKFFERDLTRSFVCKRAKVLLKDSDMSDFTSFTLISESYSLTGKGRIKNFTGFALHYNDSVFVIVKIKGAVPFKSKKYPELWYFKKLSKKRVLAVEIPLHLLIKE